MIVFILYVIACHISNIRIIGTVITKTVTVQLDAITEIKLVLELDGIINIYVTYMPYI